MRTTRMFWLALAATTAMSGAIIDTTNAGVVAGYQTGATVVDFESIATITPMAITAYTDAVPITAGATLFNEVPGVQFSVGGNPGTFNTEPVVFELGGGIAGDAESGTNVLGSADMAGNTKFNGFIELYFPTKVSVVGFWLNPALGSVLIIAKDNQLAFAGGSENVLETSGTLAAGHFVGFDRPTADIGGVTIIALDGSGMTIDDLTFKASDTVTVPEPSTLGLCLAGLLAAWAGRRRLSN